MEWTFNVLDDNGEVVSSSKANEDGPIVEPANVEPDNVEPANVEPDNVEPANVEPANVEPANVEPAKLELDDDKIMSYLKERYELEIDSLEDVLKKDEKQPLPEDVAKFLEYKNETGRGFEDYLNLQKDWNQVDDNAVLRQYYKETKPHLDAEDIDFLIKKNFSYDEEFGDEEEVREVKVALKDELYKARNHFNDQKERFKAPLESSSANLPEDVKEAYSFYNEYKQNSQKEQELAEERAKIFSEKTNNLFNNEFKGFEFDLGDKKQAFVPKDVDKVKEFQSDISNFFAQHLDDKGVVKDATSYHKALFAATNADAMAKYFYEQGKADATNGIVKETKNIDMSVRDNKDVSSDNGIKFRLVDDSNEFKFGFKK